MTDLLAALRAAEVTAKGVIRDRALPQKDLKEIEQFGEADREVILQVGKGERAEAILRANHGFHLIQHAPAPTEPHRFEIRSISESANPMSWVALALVAMMAVLFAWQQHGRRSAVKESDALRAAIGQMREENERQKSELVDKDGKLRTAEKSLSDQAGLIATLQSQLAQTKDKAQKKEKQPKKPRSNKIRQPNTQPIPPSQ